MSYVFSNDFPKVEDFHPSPEKLTSNPMRVYTGRFYDNNNNIETGFPFLQTFDEIVRDDSTRIKIGFDSKKKSTFFSIKNKSPIHFLYRFCSYMYFMIGGHPYAFTGSPHHEISQCYISTKGTNCHIGSICFRKIHKGNFIEEFVDKLADMIKYCIEPSVKNFVPHVINLNEIDIPVTRRDKIIRFFRHKKNSDLFQLFKEKNEITIGKYNKFSHCLFHVLSNIIRPDWRLPTSGYERTPDGQFVENCYNRWRSDGEEYNYNIIVAHRGVFVDRCILYFGALTFYISRDGRIGICRCAFSPCSAMMFYCPLYLRSPLCDRERMLVDIGLHLMSQTTKVYEDSFSLGLFEFPH